MAGGRGGEFERASFYCADLRDPRICYANLKGVDLRGAGLRGADLSFSMDGADLRAAVMLRHDSQAGHVRAVLPGNSPTRGGVDFSNCSLKGASLNEVNLNGANFHNAILHGVRFRRAKLTEVNLAGAILTGVNVSELPFSSHELLTCVFDPSARAVSRAPLLLDKLMRHELWVSSGAKLGQAAVLDDEDFRPLKNGLQGRELTALCARHAVLVGVNFSLCQLQGANFSESDLRDCNFEGADLRGVNFRGANLARAHFGKSDMRPLKLANGMVQPVALTGAQFDPTQFAAAISWPKPPRAVGVFEPRLLRRERCSRGWPGGSPL